MATETIRNDIEKWKELTFPQRMYDILVSLCDTIDVLEEEVKTLKSERIVKGVIETPPLATDSSDSETENEFCTICTEDKHISSVSAENPQEQPIYVYQIGRCCGNCVHFSGEDASGDGYCESVDLEMECSDSPCHQWKHRPLQDGDAVMWKQNGEHSPEPWKLGYYCTGAPFGHLVRDRRDGGTAHRVYCIKPYDIFNPYKQ